MKYKAYYIDKTYYYNDFSIIFGISGGSGNTWGICFNTKTMTGFSSYNTGDPESFTAPKEYQYYHGNVFHKMIFTNTSVAVTNMIIYYG